MTRLVAASSDAEIAEIRELFREYAASLGVDLEYQGFEAEVEGLPGSYAPPRGLLLLARAGERTVGCVGVRPLDDPEVAEMKRLYVRPEGRGLGLGRALAEAAIAFAAGHGYRAMRLDTLPSMRSAQALYASLGFRTIAPYRYSAVEGTVFMERALHENLEPGSDG